MILFIFTSQSMIMYAASFISQFPRTPSIKPSSQPSTPSSPSPYPPPFPPHLSKQPPHNPPSYYTTSPHSHPKSSLRNYQSRSRPPSPLPTAKTPSQTHVTLSQVSGLENSALMCRAGGLLNL